MGVYRVWAGQAGSGMVGAGPGGSGQAGRVGAGGGGSGKVTGWSWAGRGQVVGRSRAGHGRVAAAFTFEGEATGQVAGQKFYRHRRRRHLKNLSCSVP